MPGEQDEARVPLSVGDVHIEGCAQSEWRPCYKGLIERGSNEHRWSGWPGAYCLDCHSEDKDEVCIGLSCACPCHAKFYEAMTKYLAQHPVGCVCEQCSAEVDWP